MKGLYKNRKCEEGKKWPEEEKRICCLQNWEIKCLPECSSIDEYYGICMIPNLNLLFILNLNYKIGYGEETRP